MFYIVEDRLHHTDIGEYTAYGIAVNGTAIRDISTDRRFVEALVRQFETEQLAPEHLQDAVEDAIILSSMLPLE